MELGNFDVVAGYWILIRGKVEVWGQMGRCYHTLASFCDHRTEERGRKEEIMRMTNNA